MHLHPDSNLSVNRVYQIRDIIQGREAICVFKEPQFPDAFITNVLDGLSVGVGELDPLGAEIPLGPEGYLRLLEQMAFSIERCLSNPTASQDRQE